MYAIGATYLFGWVLLTFSDLPMTHKEPTGAFQNRT